MKAGTVPCLMAALLATTFALAVEARQAAPKVTPPEKLTDPISRAAVAAGEPPLQTILERQGYTLDVAKDEIPAQRFVKAGREPVVFMPLAAYGLLKICSGGWYVVGPKDPGAKPEPPAKTRLWRVDAPHNKQPFPPMMLESHMLFDPGARPFGLWVATEGFPGETVCTEDALQVFVPRFKPDDRHKARVYPVIKNGKRFPHTYLIGWEYSTNNDFQDMVTLISNVKPAP